MGLTNIIMGIDPGTLFTGYGILQETAGELSVLEFGVIDSKPTVFMAERLFHLGSSLENLIKQFKPTSVSLEKTFFAKNADSAMKLGQARGVCLYEATRARLPVFEYNPTEVKKGLTGSGRAEKEQVQMMVQVLLSFSAQQKQMLTKLDMSDALALAIHHARVISTLQKMKAAENRP